jgi:DNA-binding CsgD family transcriptional regulator
MRKKTNRVIYRLWHNKSVTGRIGYVGQDSYYPNRVRLSSRAKNAQQPKLFRAFNKYPWKIWKVEILASNLKSKKELNKVEIFYIKKFDSKNKGYNCTDGGDGLFGYRGFSNSRRWIPKNSEEIIKMYTEGQLSCREIAEKLKVSSMTINRFLRQNKIKGKSYGWAKLWLPKHPNKVINSYLCAHQSLVDIAKEHKVSISTVWLFLIGKGIEMRPRLESSIHVRYHIGRKKPNPRCALCSEQSLIIAYA